MLVTTSATTGRSLRELTLAVTSGAIAPTDLRAATRQAPLGPTE